MASTKKAVKAQKFVKALLEGKTQKDAAIEAGCPEKSAKQQGSRLAKSPEVQKEISDLRKKMEARNLGIDRALSELDRGLKRGKMGSHSDYLEKQIKMLNAVEQGGKVPAIGEAVIQNLFIEAEKRGLSTE